MREPPGGRTGVFATPIIFVAGEILGDCALGDKNGDRNILGKSPPAGICDLPLNLQDDCRLGAALEFDDDAVAKHGAEASLVTWDRANLGLCAPVGDAIRVSMHAGDRINSIAFGSARKEREGPLRVGLLEQDGLLGSITPPSCLVVGGAQDGWDG